MHNYSVDNSFKCLDTHINEQTNQNSILVPKVVKPYFSANNLPYRIGYPMFINYCPLSYPLRSLFKFKKNICIYLSLIYPFSMYFFFLCLLSWSREEKYPEILRDKTMADKWIYIPNDDTHNYPLCRMVENFEHST